jgi:hypothetical protein
LSVVSCQCLRRLSVLSCRLSVKRLIAESARAQLERFGMWLSSRVVSVLSRLSGRKRFLRVGEGQRKLSVVGCRLSVKSSLLNLLVRMWLCGPSFRGPRSLAPSSPKQLSVSRGSCQLSVVSEGLSAECSCAARRFGTWLCGCVVSVFGRLSGRRHFLRVGGVRGSCLSSVVGCQ